MTSTNDKTVTIIGAGLAGLSAAYNLQRAGWRVTVLEARYRVGGRVYSVRSFSNGAVAEAGGEFIEDSHSRMLALARQFDLKLGRVGSWQAQDGDWASFEGKSGPMAEISGARIFRLRSGRSGSRSLSWGNMSLTRASLRRRLKRIVSTGNPLRNGSTRWTRIRSRRMISSSISAPSIQLSRSDILCSTLRATRRCSTARRKEKRAGVWLAGMI